MDELRGILEQRTPLYEQCDGQLDTSDKDTGAIVVEALAWLAAGPS